MPKLPSQETSQLSCSGNKLTSFYMMVTLAYNKLTLPYLAHSWQLYFTKSWKALCRNCLAWTFRPDRVILDAITNPATFTRLFPVKMCFFSGTRIIFWEVLQKILMIREILIHIENIQYLRKSNIFCGHLNLLIRKIFSRNLFFDFQLSRIS